MKPLSLIAGPCVIESRDNALYIAEYMHRLSLKHEIDYIFKASYDKANRTSLSSYRGPGIDEGLSILHEIKSQFGLKILTDIHDKSQAIEAAKVADVIQIPAFLCRQTDLLRAAAEAAISFDRSLNIKKGQFLAPWDMRQVVSKLEQFNLPPSSGKLWLTERGTCFGYNTLVVDFRSIPQLKEYCCPVFFDATHAVQQPGGLADSSGGQRQYVSTLARCAVAAGADGLFMEVHPDPDQALSDGPNMVPLTRMDLLLTQLIHIREAMPESFAPTTN